MSTKIHVALLPGLLPPQNFETLGFAVVIDTLRFTTTACQAIAVGAQSVFTVSEISDAFALRKADSSPLLCGERNCCPIQGFDLGNSPLEYTETSVVNRDLIFSTTNGTRAVEAARSAHTVFLGALVNRNAVADLLDSHELDRGSIICAGTDGSIAMEDVLAAGAILDANPKLVPDNDSAALALAAWQSLSRKDAKQLNSHKLSQRLEVSFRHFAGGANLVEQGYASDLKFASEVDTITKVPTSQSEWNRFS